MTAHRPMPPDGDAVDQYLWDGSGPPEAEVARLERALEPLRYRAKAPTTFQHRSAPTAAASPRWLRAAAAFALSMAGIAAVAIVSDAFKDVGTLKQQRLAAAATGGWSVVALQGSPLVGAQHVSGQGTLRVGQWVETDAQSKVEIRVADIGQVTVEPHSRVRLLATDARKQRLELARGRIDAFISAPPRLFVVDTPAAAAVDLGCAYTLDVADDGSGVLSVTLGWVNLEWNGRESLVPRKATCQTRPGVGPGTPMFDDAPVALRQAVDELDFGAGGSPAMEIVLETARDRDSLTLWHLMVREATGSSARARLLDRLVAAQPLPAGVTRESIERGDAQALARWRAEFPWSPPQ